MANANLVLFERNWNKNYNYYNKKKFLCFSIVTSIFYFDITINVNEQILWMLHSTCGCIESKHFQQIDVCGCEHVMCWVIKSFKWPHLKPWKTIFNTHPNRSFEFDSFVWIGALILNIIFRFLCLKMWMITIQMQTIFYWWV